MQSAVRASHCSHAACYSVWKKIKEQIRNNPARHSEKLSHITALSQLTLLNGGSVCTYTENKLVMPSSPFFCLLQCFAYTCSEPPHNPAQQHCWATPAQQSQKSQNSGKVWLGRKKKKPRKYMSLWTLISFHSLFSSVLLSPIIKIK